MEDNSTLPALAEKLALWFPELEGQCTAVTEADFNKETAPNLPFGMVSLINISFQASENSLAVYPIENILINFLMPIKRYLKEDGSESPFWAYYNYQPFVDRLIYHLNDWKTPLKSRVVLVQMDLDVTEYAAVLSFRVTHRYQNCYVPTDDLCKPSILQDGRPMQIFGGVCPAKDVVCEDNPCEEETDPCQRSM